MPTTARSKPNSATCCDEPASRVPPAAERPRGGLDEPGAPRRPSWAASALLAAVRVYQVLLSPVVGGSCRFTPSCSHYMAEAVSRHGALAGFWLGLRRLSRCHPLGPSGFDPVPEAWPPLPAAGGPGRHVAGALPGSGVAPSPSPASAGGRRL